MYLGSISNKTHHKGHAETKINVIEAPTGLRLRKEKEGELEARWNELPHNKSLGFYEVQIGCVSGSRDVEWLDSFKLDINRKIFTGLKPNNYTFRVRTIASTPMEDRPNEGPWGQLEAATLLEAGAVLNRGLVDIEMLEGETCRLSIECGGVVRNAAWYLNGARMSNDFVSVEGETHQLILRDLKESGIAVVEWRCGDLESQCKLTVKGKPPRLMRGLQSQSVPLDTDVVMSVRLSKIATGTGMWTINGEKIPEIHTRISSDKRDELYTMTIKNCTVADSGPIEFTLAVPDSPPIVSRATLEVIRPKPAIETGLDDKTAAEEAQNAVFRFFVDPSKVNQVNWFHNGRGPLKDGLKYLITRNSETGEVVLTIQSCSMGDAGKVEARIGNESTSSTLDVTKGPARFTCSRIQRMETQCGQSVEISVTLSRADAQVTWLKDGEKITDGRVTSSADGCNRTLHIEKVRYPGDSGTYRCEVDDDERVDIALDVQKAFETFLTPLESAIDTIAGKELVLETEVSADDVAVQWLRDGLMIRKSDKVSIEQNEQWRRIRFRDIEPLDAGEYTCETLHDKSTTRVTVSEPVITVLSELSDQECVEGGTVSFQLQLSHSLRSQVPTCWMLNAKPLVHNQEQIQISALPNGHYSMTMRQLKRSDVGTINFTAGRVRLTAKLNVTLPPIRFMKDLQSVSCHVGECVVLLTEVNHIEHAVKWLKEGVEISSKSTHYTAFSDGVMRKLRIQHSKEDDTAEYTVVAVENTDLKRSTAVTVTKPPIGILHPLQDLEIEEGDVAEFVLEISRPVKIEFFQDETKLKHVPGEIEIESDGDGTIHRIFLFNLREEDSGMIRAYAPTASEFISEALLDVLRPPIHFTQPLRDSIVELKKKVILSCEISDVDAPVQWLYNSEPIHIDVASTFTVESIDAVRQLVIHKAHNHHEGIYSCVTPDMRKTSCELFVQKPEVKFIECLNDQECYMGDTVEAKIRLSVSDAGGLWEWDYDHLEAAPGRVDITREQEEHRIVLHDVRETGVLGFVVAKNCNSICRITALERPIKFLHRLDDIETFEDQDFVLQCELTMDKLQGMWTFEDNEIRLGERFRYEIDGGIHRLHVKMAQYDTVGKYGFRCGKKLTFSAVSMKEMDVDILSGATDLRIKEGKQFCLSVVISNPRAYIKWRKDGEPIMDSEHFTLIATRAGEPGGPPEGVRYVLQVEQARSNDEGSYTFDAQNGRATCTAKVHVKREPAVVIRPLDAQKIRDSEKQVEFEVEFSRDDIKATWSRDNRVLRGERFVMTRVDRRKWHLTLKNPIVEDTGLYCVECDDCASHAMLRVIPWKTEIIEHLKTQTAELNAKAEFKCALSLPNIKLEEVEWYWNEERVLQTDDKFTYGIDDEYIHYCHINRVEEEMLNGVIRFEVRDVKSDATLLVYIPPSPPKHVRIVKAKHDWAILQWDAPSTLGSLPIIGYVLEVRVEDQKWAPIGPSLILGARTEIDGLEGGVEHRFRVKAVTEHGLAAASVTTDPLIPWVPLKVSKHLPAESSCFEEDTKVLECKFTLTEEQEPCEWYHESDIIDFSTSLIYENVSDGVRRKLKIKNAELDHSGLYICKVGDFTSETILEVEPRPPSFAETFEHVATGLGSDVIFRCETDKRDVNVLWMKNGMELLETDRHDIIWDDCHHSLEIKNIEEDDIGEYS